MKAVSCVALGSVCSIIVYYETFLIIENDYTLYKSKTDFKLFLISAYVSVMIETVGMFLQSVTKYFVVLFLINLFVVEIIRVLCVFTIL